MLTLLRVSQILKLSDKINVYIRKRGNNHCSEIWTKMPMLTYQCKIKAYTYTYTACIYTWTYTRMYKQNAELYTHICIHIRNAPIRNARQHFNYLFRLAEERGLYAKYGCNANFVVRDDGVCILSPTCPYLTHAPHANVQINIYAHENIHAQTHARTHIRTYTHTHSHIHTYTCIHIRANAHTHT